MKGVAVQKRKINPKSAQQEPRKSGGAASSFEDKRQSSADFSDNRGHVAQMVVDPSVTEKAGTGKGSSSSLPNDLRTGVEALSGQSMSGVTVHHGSAKPAQLKAQAVAQGDEIHLGQGQEKHLPHEAWHVAQQRQGRVQPTAQLKGIGVNQDTGLEREADVMGAHALAIGRSADAKPSVTAGRSGSPVVQGKFMDSVKNFFGFGKKEKEKPGGDKARPAEAKATPPKAVTEVPKTEVAAEKSTSEPEKEKTLPTKEERDQDRAKKKDDFLIERDKTLGIHGDKLSKKEKVTSTEGGKEVTKENRVALSADERKQNADKEKASQVKSAESGMIYGDARNPVGNYKSKLTDIVKEVQSSEVTLQQRDAQINGDAAVNAYFGDDKRLSGDQESLAAQGKKTLTEKYQKLVMTPDKSRFKKSEIQLRKAQSLDSARASKTALQETANDRSVVEMFWNELEKKNEEYSQEKDADKKKQLATDASKIYQFAFDRKVNTDERVLDAEFEKDQLDKEGRVAGILDGISIGTAVFGVMLNKLSMGFLDIRGHKDKRGFNSGTDYDLNLETGEAEQVDLMKGKVSIGGNREVITIIQKVREVNAEFRGKMAKRSGAFPWLSQVAGTAKKYFDLLKSVVSAAALWFTGLAIGFPVFAVAASVMTGLSFYISLVNMGLTSLKVLFDSLAQLTNNNPNLFLELAGETVQSTVSLAGQGAGFFGNHAGLAAAKAASDGDASTSFDPAGMVDKSSKFDGDKVMENLAKPKKEFIMPEVSLKGVSAGSLGDSSFYAEKGIALGWNAADSATVGAGMAVDKVLPPEVHKGAAKNARTYDKSVDEARRFQPLAGETQEKEGDEESRYIRDSYETTKLKASLEARLMVDKLNPIVGSKPVSVPSNPEISEEEQSDAQGVAGAVSAAKATTAEFKKIMEDQKEGK